MSEPAITVGVVGLGYWGPNLARNFDRLPQAELRWICDGSEASRERWGQVFPDARVSADLDELLADPELDAVVIATPVPTHAALAVRVLRRTRSGRSAPMTSRSCCGSPAARSRSS